MKRICAVLVTAAAIAAVAGAGTAHAADSLTCLSSGLIGNITGSSYQLEANATCAGVLNGSVVLPALNNAFISSNGEYSGDFCTFAVLGDHDGATTSLGVFGAGTLTDVGYTIQTLLGKGTIAWAGGGFAGEGTVTFTRGGLPGACLPGSPGQLEFSAAFTLARVP